MNIKRNAIKKMTNKNGDKSNNRVREQISNRRASNSQGKPNSTGRIGAVDSSQMQNNDLNSKQNSEQNVNQKSNNIPNPLGGNAKGDEKGEAKVKIPKKLKIQLYIYLGCAILFLSCFIILIALIDSFFS